MEVWRRHFDAKTEILSLSLLYMMEHSFSTVENAQNTHSRSLNIAFFYFICKKHKQRLEEETAALRMQLQDEKNRFEGEIAQLTGELEESAKQSDRQCKTLRSSLKNDVLVLEEKHRKDLLQQAAQFRQERVDFDRKLDDLNRDLEARETELRETQKALESAKDKSEKMDSEMTALQGANKRNQGLAQEVKQRKEEVDALKAQQKAAKEETLELKRK